MRALIAASLRSLFLCATITVTALLSSCTSPLDLDTPVRKTTLDIDSLVATDSFTGAPGDSIFATVNGQQIIFATETQRPSYYNAVIDGAHYVTIKASRFSLNGSNYEAMSLRMDGVRDTGTYTINGPYSAPKQIDIESEHRFGALYERRDNGGYMESYRTDGTGTGGRIRVIRIDTARGVMVGTFSFRGYSVESDSMIVIEQGAFRLQVKK